MKIFKYKLLPGEPVQMPAGAQVISAHEQTGDICVWALVPNPGTKLEPRNFLVVGTGHEIPRPMRDWSHRFVGTVLLEGGTLVFHVFEHIYTGSICD